MGSSSNSSLDVRNDKRHIQRALRGNSAGAAVVFTRPTRSASVQRLGTGASTATRGCKTEN
jgi:hypothetical protein